ncbi:MAG: PepSY domain-containing protein [Kordiimonadaceae bacterium]|nr:PepSY domain-containing protein [Kordiimonadaceae bacterium]
MRKTTLKLHNWVGLVIGIQFLFWTVGGTVMTVLPLDLVRGELSTAKQSSVVMSADQITDIVKSVGWDNVASVRGIRIGNGEYAEVRSLSGRVEVRSLTNPSAVFSPDAKALVTEVAEADFFWRGAEAGDASGYAKAISAELLIDEPGDFRRELPVWQVKLDDPDGTIIYVSPKNYRVVTRRNDYWRFFDFFWMLHILDFDERSDINNWLIITASISATLFMFTGVILLYFRFWPWQGNKRRRNAAAKIAEVKRAA